MATASRAAVRALEPLQKPDEGLGVFALLSVQQGTAVDMTLSQSKLVHGNVAHLGERSVLEPAAQVALVEVLDEIPTDPEQTRHMLDGRQLAEIHHIPGKGFGCLALP